MKLNRWKIVLVITLSGGLLGPFFLLNGCEGSATQTTNEHGLYGVLVDGKGDPVANAKVHALSSEPDAKIDLKDPDKSVMARTETDSHGHYSLTGLINGNYNVIGVERDGASSVLIPNIRLLSTNMNLGVDTLLAPGKITGQVVFDGAPLEGVFCYIPGTFLVTITDLQGKFILDRVPDGIYRFKYVSENYISIEDSQVVVRSGETTTLSQKTMVLDTTIQPPIPKGLRAEYDSVTGLVSLTWNRVNISDLAGYRLEFYPSGYVDVDHIVVVDLGKDTVWEDSSSVINFSELAIWDSLGKGKMVYRVKSVDNDGNSSRAFSSPFVLELLRPSFLNVSVSITLSNGVFGVPLCRDTIKFISKISGILNNQSTPYWGVTWKRSDGFWPDAVYGIQPKDIIMDTVMYYWGQDIRTSLNKPEPDSLKIVQNISFTGPGEVVRFYWKRVIVTEVVNDCYLVHEARRPYKGEWNK